MNQFVGFPFERLRFEYEKRERKLAEIKDDVRRLDEDHNEAMMDGDLLGSTRSAFIEFHQEKSAEFSEQTKALQQELKQIEEAMNA
jgi:hypothetical protein